MNRDQQVAGVLTEALGAIEDQVWKLYETGKDQAAISMASGLVARCKAADPIDQLGAQFLALLRDVGDDEARAWLEGAIAEMQGDDDEAAPVAPTAKVTDSGKMSKPVMKDAFEAALTGLPYAAPAAKPAAPSFLAAAFGADQARSERTKR